MQCIRVTSLKNVTLQTRRDDDDFNFADRNGFGRLAVQLTGSVIINNNNFLFAYVFVHVTFINMKCTKTYENNCVQTCINTCLHTN